MKIQIVVLTKDFSVIKGDVQEITDEQFKELDDFLKELCAHANHLEFKGFYIPGKYLRNNCIIRVEKITDPSDAYM